MSSEVILERLKYRITVFLGSESVTVRDLNSLLLAGLGQPWGPNPLKLFHLSKNPRSERMERTGPSINWVDPPMLRPLLVIPHWADRPPTSP